MQIRFIPIFVDKDSPKLIVAFRCIDNIVEQELEQRKETEELLESSHPRLRVITGLCTEYESLYYVDAKRDEYFKNSENFGKYPDAYYLIKYLKKQSEKLQSGHIYVRCQLCKQTVDLAKYDQHFDRCSSADYL